MAMKSHISLSLLLAVTATGAHAACGGSGDSGGMAPESLQRAQTILDSNGIAVGKEYRAIRWLPMHRVPG